MKYGILLTETVVKFGSIEIAFTAGNVVFEATTWPPWRWNLNILGLLFIECNFSEREIKYISIIVFILA